MGSVDELKEQLAQLQTQFSSTKTERDRLHQQANALLREKQNLELQRDAVYRVSAKLPAFWSDKPAVWFSQAEAQFSISGITADSTKYGYVVTQLDTRVAAELEDILCGPEENRTYAKLKENLISRLSLSEERRVKKLISEEEMGDRKPSQYLRHLRSLAGSSTAVSDKLLKQIWLQRLPSTASAILTSQSQLELDALAQLADRIVEVAPAPAPAVFAVNNKVTPNAPDPVLEQLSKLTAQIAALTSNNNQQREQHFRSRSRSRSFSREQPSRKQNNDLCWYHSQYKEKARKCTEPCAYKTGNANGNQ